jgi:integrase
MSELYNSHIKNEFLSKYDNADTRTTYFNLFRKIAGIEENRKYDLYDFNIEDVKEVMRELKLVTKASARTSGSVIKKYINWAAKYRESNINILSGLKPSWFESFVIERELYISETRMNEIINRMVNPQDQVTVKLLFLSVNGYQHSELLNLTKNDIKGNTLLLTDDRKGQREVTVDDKTIEIINRAILQTDYTPKNGSGQRSTESKMIENDYVVRGLVRRASNFERADKNLIYRRVTGISEFFGIPYLTPKSIWKSGQIKMAADLYRRDGEITTKQFNEIAEEFNLTKVTNNGYEMYAITQIKDYINKDNLKELYDIDVEI